MRIIFVDIETTGLDPDTHELVEYALVPETAKRLDDRSSVGEGRTGFNTGVRKALPFASVDALRINRYYERAYDAKVATGRLPQNIALDIALTTSGALLAGANPQFDQRFLDVWMRRNGYAPAWDYHVLDVPTYAAAVVNALGFTKKPLEPPFRMNNELLDALSIKRDEASKHTALGDALLARQIWDRVKADI